MLSKKAACDKGRSEIDFFCVFVILGFVAIIALVGVNKYRVYKHGSVFDVFFDNTLRVYSYLEERNSENVSGIFNIFKLIPEGVTYDGKSFYDNFSTNVTIKNRNVVSKDGSEHFDYYMLLNFYDPYLGLLPTNPKLCYNFLHVIKKNADKIEWIDIRQGTSTLNLKMFGRDFCHGANCLSSLSTKNIKDLCYYCTSDTYCSMYIQLSTKMVKEKDEDESEKNKKE